MDLSELSVLQKADVWFHQGDQVHLITVLQSWGSSPRPVGAMAAIRNGRELIGSVSGGCVEEDLLTRIANGDFSETEPTTCLYGETAEEQTRLRLPCGGKLNLLIEPIGEQSGLKEMVKQLQLRQRFTKLINVQNGQIRQTEAAPNCSFDFTNPILQHPMGPDWQLYLVGASQVAAYLAEIARPLGYNTKILEPRPEYAESWQPLEGVELIKTSPDDYISSQAIDRQCAIITLAHDPRVDDMALIEALTSSAFYIAALGSSRSQAGRVERLTALGLTAVQLSRLHAPAGFPIGSKTPAEIAISIAAQLTAEKHAVQQATR